MNRPRVRALAAVVAVLLADGCGGGAGRDSVDTTAGRRPAAEPTDAPSTSAPASVPTSVATPVTTSGDVASPTTAGELDATALCDVLRSDGYESRKAARALLVAAGGDEALGDVRQRCAADLDRLDAAMAVEARREAALAVDPPIDVSALSCGASGFDAVVTNRTSEPLGAHLSFRYVLEPSEKIVATGDVPIVIWRLAPGESVPVSGTATYQPKISVGCRLGGVVFLADDSAADAGLAGATDPELTGDDPARWLPRLLEVELATLGSGEADTAASVEDVRSAAYTEVVEDTDAAYSDSRDLTVRVCPGTVRSSGPDLMTFVAFQEWSEGRIERGDGVEIVPAGSRLSSGVFRRGSDGQWRWLGTSQPYASSHLWETCGRPTD